MQGVELMWVADGPNAAKATSDAHCQVNKSIPVGGVICDVAGDEHARAWFSLEAKSLKEKCGAVNIPPASRPPPILAHERAGDRSVAMVCPRESGGGLPGTKE